MLVSGKMKNEMAKTLIALGMVLIVLGIAVTFFNKIPGLGKLPGDILIKRENFTFYFPLTTCILISIVLSLFFFLWNQK